MNEQSDETVKEPLKDMKYYLAQGYEVKSSHVDGGRHCIVMQKGSSVVISTLTMSLLFGEFTKNSLISECTEISP